MSESYLGLARKWRPRTFDEMVGQEDVARSLASAIASNRIGHGHILSGPRGVGKTTSARILARALNCVKGPTATPCGECRHCVAIAAGNDMDVSEFDAASKTGVDDMRELLEGAMRAAFDARYKVYIVDEVHMLSRSSFNALLKTLEEPPPGVIFIFATTELEKIPETVRSRCQIHELRRLTREDIVRRLGEVAAGEGIEIAPDTARAIFGLIAQTAEGGMRDALVAFDQILALTNGRPDLEAAERLLGLSSSGAVADAIQWLHEGEAVKLLGLVEDLVARGRSLERFVKTLLSVLHDVMLAQAGAPRSALSVTGDALARVEDLCRRVPRVTVFNMIHQVFELEERIKRSTQVRYLLEFAFLRIAAIKPVVPVDDLIRRLQALPDRPVQLPEGPGDGPGAGVGNGAGGAISPGAARAPAAELSVAAAPPRPAPASAPAPAMSRSAAAPGARSLAVMNDVAFDAIPTAYVPPPVASAPASGPAPSSPAPASGPAPSSPAPAYSSPIAASTAASDHPLLGLSREELLEAIDAQLPDAQRPLMRTLRSCAAMRADTDDLWIQWAPGDAVSPRTLARPENARALEAALARLRGAPMRARWTEPSDALESASSGAPVGQASEAPRPRPVPYAAARFSDSDGMPMPPDDDAWEMPPPSVLRQMERGGSAPTRPVRTSAMPEVTEATTRAALASDQEFARRARMVKEFFSGSFVDSGGNPLTV